MSHLAQAFQKQLDELRSKQKQEKRKKVRMTQDEHDTTSPPLAPVDGVEADAETTTAEAEPKGETVPTTKSKKSKPRRHEPTQESSRVAKKQKAPHAKKEKAKKEPKPKGVSGRLVSVSKGSDRYLDLNFEQGRIRLSPTSNREQNRDIAAKTISDLLK